jgi:SAM-dependent methyltransferase
VSISTASPKAPADRTSDHRWWAAEPHKSELERLIREGAGTLDIPRATADTAYTRPIAAYDALVERELSRVAVHCQSLNQLLEAHVGAVDRVLDVGCGTGATTVAMALSEGLSARELVGLDPNEHSLTAARVRARAHHIDPQRIRFSSIEPQAPLPFTDGRFDLTVCVSVIEYLHAPRDRQRLVSELERVTRPGGHLLLVTPSPFRLRDHHTQRLIGDWRRTAGYPWASPPWQLAAMFRASDRVDVRRHQLESGLGRRGLPVRVPAPLGFLANALPWQKMLMRKR